VGQPATYSERFLALADECIASEFAAFREALLKPLSSNLGMLEFCEKVIAYLKPKIKVDRIYLCDTANGVLCAGWMKGRNLLSAQDWQDEPCPLEMDATLQQALESDELIINPVAGIGADLAVAIRFPNRAPWLMVLDETQTARGFSGRDLIFIYLARDLILLKRQIQGQV